MLTKSTGEHFNTPGHNMADMQVTILEQLFNSDPQFRKTRQKCILRDSTQSTKDSTRRLEIANCNIFLKNIFI